MPTPRNNTYAVASGTNVAAGAGTQSPLSFPPDSLPTNTGGSGSNAWRFYLGQFSLHPGGFYDDTGFPYLASYSRDATMPAAPRLCVDLHASGGFVAVDNNFAPATGFNIECKTQDGQVKGTGGEWWAYSDNGQPYGMRRVAEMIRALVERYPTIDTDDKGIMVYGNSMGTGGVVATMLLPDPWRSKIAYVKGTVGVWMFRRINEFNERFGWPADNGSNDAIWDAIDFEARAATDPIIRGIHYRERFCTNDGSSEGPAGSTQAEWVNICETNKISVYANWGAAGHAAPESGLNFPNTAWETAEQDVTLDRAHPCFTGASSNYPTAQADRVNEATHPRGHYNMGLTWDHANIVDSATEVILPIKYTRRTGFGYGVPDQPTTSTVNVTPRRPRSFTITNGETVYWSFDSGAQTGSATVVGDTITATGIVLTSGAIYKNLRFYKA